jgi:TfoX/Sxy family transcriptional regulator of competence genes
MAYDQVLAGRIRELVAAEKGLTEKRMFGGLAFLIEGNMAVAANGQGGLLLRVDPGETSRLLTRPGARPMVMRGREMDGWLRIDGTALDNRRNLQRWVGRGVAYARSLPPKR